MLEYLLSQHSAIWTHLIPSANYRLATIYCRKTLSHGGVAIYVKSNLTNYKILDVNNYSMDEVFEVTGILLSSIKLIVLFIYRTADSDNAVGKTHKKV